MKITLRQLQVFDAVAALGSVTVAAERLGMSQSAVSGALSDFQIILRRQLFVHSKGRPLRITEDGRALQAAVRSLLGEADAIEQGSAAPLSGRLVVGATTTIAETVLPQLCVAFMQAHPGVRVDIEAAPSAELCARLARLELDTALVEVFPDAAGISLTHWRTDEMWLVVPPSHPLAGRGRLRRADLTGVLWCLRGPHSAVAGRLRYELHQDVGQLDIGFQSTSPWAVRLAVLAGGGVGCLSRTMLQYDVKHGQLVRLEIADFELTRSLSLARPAGARRGLLTAAFDDWLLANGDGDQLEVG